MNKKYTGSIGGNGFQDLNYYAVDQMVASTISLKSLAIIGADILAAGEKLNDAAGAIAVAHDKKAGF